MSSLSPNLFVGEVAWKEQHRIDAEENWELLPLADYMLSKNENSILTKFVNMEELVATDRIAILIPTLRASEDCQKCSKLESDIKRFERENGALTNANLNCPASLSAAAATNESERQAWEKQQQQLLEKIERQLTEKMERQLTEKTEKMEREAQAREQQQQQLLEKTEKMEREAQAREQQQQQLLEKTEKMEREALAREQQQQQLTEKTEKMEREALAREQQQQQLTEKTEKMEREALAREQQQQQLLEKTEKMEREAQAREQQQQQMLKREREQQQQLLKREREQQQQLLVKIERQLTEKMERETQTREQEMQQKFTVVEEAMQGLRSDVDALIDYSDIYVLNLASEIIKRLLKKQSNGGAQWSASSIFEEREKDIVRTSIRNARVTYEVRRFADLSARLLNARNSAIHFAEDGDNLPLLAQRVLQVLERLSRSRALDVPMTFALNVLKMSGDLLSRV
eukprot:gene1049-759_t